MDAPKPAVIDAFRRFAFRPEIAKSTDSLSAAINMLREATMKPLAYKDVAGLPGSQWLLQKAFTQPTSAISGLAQYDLEQGARLLYPITTILRNMIPRQTGGLGIQANWRSITAVNPSRISINLAEGQRGAAMAQTVTDNLAKFSTQGLDNFVTEQAYMAALTFEDLMALMATETLQATMEAEELLDIGGNSSVALQTTPTPTQGAVSNTGGSFSNGTYSVICVALTFDGMTRASVSSTGVPLPYTRANMDGTTTPIQGFCGIQSAALSVTLSGGTSTQQINAKVAAVTGAFGYAWYEGSGGSEKIVAITGYPSVTINAAPAGTNQAATAIPATDTSLNSLTYDGILTQIVKSGSGAYVKDLGGAALTSSGSGSGGITEFDNLISDRISNYRLVPTDIFMSPYDHGKASALILNGNTNLAPFVMGDASENGLSAAAQLKVYNNKVGFGNTRLDVHAHPFIPQGTALFYSRTNPYPLSNVPNLIRKLLRRDYWSVEWPVVTMQRTMGVYFDGVLQVYFPPAFGVITGMSN
ncbi:MAG TPA: hypothetical protein VMS04_15590 [Vicinamibacterales bacterium]|jgi:hypothetical protein|nr:hypothetical protein [Vicinamibacterales bacterium]